MRKNKKNDSVKIGSKTYIADKDGIFTMDLVDVHKRLIDELPLDRKCLICNETKFEDLKSPIIRFDSPDKINLLFVRRNTGLVEIIFAEEVYPGDMDIEITTKYFYSLKESVLLSNRSLNPKIIKHECNSQDQVSFEFSIEITASTIVKAFEKAVNTDTSIVNTIAHAVEKGTNCIRFVLEGAFHIDVSNIFSGKDKNSSV